MSGFQTAPLPGLRTAWQEVCATYPALAANYRASSPGRAKIETLRNLPSLRPLREGPPGQQQNNRTRQPSQPLKTIRTAKEAKNVQAALIQVSGQESTRMCKTCERGSGRWDTCVGAVFGPLGKQPCANCDYNWNGTRCEPSTE
ncbi:hypothetical protein F5Y18DRAFT_388980 [Xylariaceae sp. FL1019]|nr:hypothetical protein F5Y18DRAFT_388980 [Xylariaceae sp. FL1019]